MKVAIIVIGDEILLGQVTDINSGEIARTLGPMGWEVAQTLVVGDNREDIKRTVEQAMSQCDLVVTTGGLGPTKDDITKQVLTEIFGGKLVMNDDVLHNVETVFAKRGLVLNDLTRSQALVPSSCTVIQNLYGTAPVMWFERNGKVLVSLPGVPFEMQGMLHGAVMQQIKAAFMPKEEYLHHTMIVSGITESDLAEKLDAFENQLPAGMHLAYLPVPGYIRLRLDSVGAKDESHRDMFDSQVANLRLAVDDFLLHDGDATPAEILLERLKNRGWTIATAESCTGGNIAHSITMIAGCSEWYKGSIVSYSNEVKANVLGVNESDLMAYGAVSEPVVRQMAENACKVIGTDCAVATSGIAGPGGGTPEKPVGTVWMAAHTPDGTVTVKKRFPGNRARVIERATTEALLLLLVKIGKLK